MSSTTSANKSGSLVKERSLLAHGEPHDGVAILLSCDRRRFQIGDAIPAMIGIFFVGKGLSLGTHDDRVITIYRSIPLVQPGHAAWLEIKDSDGREMPYRGPLIGREPWWESERTVKMRHRMFVGVQQADIGAGYDLTKPGTYTVRWHYNPKYNTAWQGHVISNQVSLEIVQ